MRDRVADLWLHSSTRWLAFFMPSRIAFAHGRKMRVGTVGSARLAQVFPVAWGCDAAGIPAWTILVITAAIKIMSSHSER